MVPLVTKFGDKPESPTYNSQLGYDPVTGYPTAMIVFGILLLIEGIGLIFWSFKVR